MPIEIKDRAKALELVLGATPCDHSEVKVNGLAWPDVLSLRLRSDAQDTGDLKLDFTCHLTDPQYFAGRFSDETGSQTFDVELYLNERLSSCALNGKRIRFISVELEASGTGPTTLQIEALLPNAEMTAVSRKVLKGVFIPSNEPTGHIGILPMDMDLCSLPIEEEPTNG